MKRMLISGLIAGCVLFILSYGGLYLGIKFFPELFIEYNNPLFNSDGSRDLLFYSHAFVFSIALAWFWQRFKGLFRGPIIIRGLEFGAVYTIVALMPVMWITFSSLDITVLIVLTWFFYGMVQATIAGLIFAATNP